MGARRTAAPAAVAAALIGAGLLLHRPRLVPELKEMPRAGSRPAAALAAAIAWPAPGPVRPAPPRAAASAAAAAAEDAADPARVEAWRDALADRPFSAIDGAGAAPRSAPPAAVRPGRQARAAAPAAASAPSSLHEAVVRLLRAAARRARAPAAAPRTPRPDSAPAAPSVRRTPLALGPAAPDESSEEDGDDAAVAVAPGGRPAGASWSRRRARFFPLFRPPRPGPSRQAGAERRRRARPLLLSRLLGRGALRPPPASVVPPDLARLALRKPVRLPDGTPTPARTYELDRIEAHDPRRGAPADRRRAPHWDRGVRWHDGPAQGVVGDARWLWLWKDKARWWAWHEPEKLPLLSHRGLWWARMRGVWFALHDGELWSWRRFSDWDAEGLIRLTDGVELVYSSDFTKVAVITPGAGAVLYDARTGAELGEWLESEMPRRRPRAPAGLRLPRGI